MQSLESRNLFKPLGSLINTRQAILEVFSEIPTFRDPQNISIAAFAIAERINSYGRQRKRISGMVKVDNELSIFIYHNLIRCDRLSSVTLALEQAVFCCKVIDVYCLLILLLGVASSRRFWRNHFDRESTNYIAVKNSMLKKSWN